MKKRYLFALPLALLASCAKPSKDGLPETQNMMGVTSKDIIDASKNAADEITLKSNAGNCESASRLLLEQQILSLLAEKQAIDLLGLDEAATSETHQEALALAQASLRLNEAQLTFTQKCQAEDGPAQSLSDTEYKDLMLVGEMKYTFATAANFAKQGKCEDALDTLLHYRLNSEKEPSLSTVPLSEFSKTGAVSFLSNVIAAQSSSLTVTGICYDPQKPGYQALMKSLKKKLGDALHAPVNI